MKITRKVCFLLAGEMDDEDIVNMYFNRQYECGLFEGRVARDDPSLYLRISGITEPHDGVFEEK